MRERSRSTHAAAAAGPGGAPPASSGFSPFRAEGRQRHIRPRSTPTRRPGQRHSAGSRTVQGWRRTPSHASSGGCTGRHPLGDVQGRCLFEAGMHPRESLLCHACPYMPGQWKHTTPGRQERAARLRGRLGTSPMPAIRAQARRARPPLVRVGGPPSTAPGDQPSWVGAGRFRPRRPRQADGSSRRAL